MNLKTIIDARLWDAVQENYENKRFTAAILDSIYFVSNLIRDKTGLESDGVILIGQALGGKEPKLKVSSLQTESDRNVQAGTEQMLRGIVQGIRNPRSHEKYADSSSDAFSVIAFINWLVGIIDRAKGQFSEEAFIEQVFDHRFVENDRYAQLLVGRIPPRKRMDIMIKVYRQKEKSDGKKLSYFIRAMLNNMTVEEIDQAYGLISEELRSCDETPLYKILQAFPVEHWHKVDEISRMRAENMVIESIKDGRYDKGGLYEEDQEKCLSGHLGTWARGNARYFALKKEVAEACLKKLRSADSEEQDYVFEYLFEELPHLMEKPPWNYAKMMLGGLNRGDKRFETAVSAILGFEDDGTIQKNPWVEPLVEAWEHFVERVPGSKEGVVPEDDDVPL